MCGIAGFFNGDHNKNNKITIRKMVKKLEHRGPDSKGYFFNNYVTLGHSRLKIIKSLLPQEKTSLEIAVKFCHLSV